ncbi:MAG: hypothetical protein RLY20_324 [Verrucomicrobiota bacterium]|jgi:protein tyrosine phosphatase (PTP) superfamily phosphohydrolase (DUF442 family)
MKRVPYTSICLTVAGLFAFASTSLAAAVEPMELPGIHNFFRATTNVFSGAQPEGDEAFAALAKLGVKTIISVDGSKPDVELADKHGLRYIHLPIGYDGITTNRVAELAKAAAVSPGPIYVHCHHGKHRGPAAVSVICMADAGWSAAQAEEFMHQAGTGAEYQGLYRAASRFVAPTAEQLAAVPNHFPSVAQTSSLVEAMVAVDNIFENLKLAQAAGWQPTMNQPDITPQHEALMLVEQFRELKRLPEITQRSADFHGKLGAALKSAEDLHQQLAGRPAPRASEAFKSVSQSCTDCHKNYRNS